MALFVNVKEEKETLEIGGIDKLKYAMLGKKFWEGIAKEEMQQGPLGKDMEKMEEAACSGRR